MLKKITFTKQAIEFTSYKYSTFLSITVIFFEAFYIS